LKFDRAAVRGKSSLPHNPALKTNAGFLQILPETGEFAGALFGKVLPPLFETIPSIFPKRKARFAPESIPSGRSVLQTAPNLLLNKCGQIPLDLKYSPSGSGFVGEFQ
jgi:hypothetical protein